MKKTKIIATIGPASEKVATLTQMVKAGMNVARLNFSHGTHENHLQIMKNVRSVSAKLQTPVAILQDLQGPKIRIKELKSPIKLKKGSTLTLGKDFFVDADIVKHLKKGHRILIEDGLLELAVVKTAGKTALCRAENSGTIQAHKGVNLPDTHLTMSVLTEKDIADLKFGLKNDVDFVALSFVHSGKDIAIVKRLIKKYSPKGKELPKVIAKIERAEALKKIDEIIAATDVIMVARGDLGVEIAESQVPIYQKTIIKKCMEAAKPVIVATQMLDSMIRNPRPTRAEVSDVANAVMDRADCVMLSGESAFGKYPVECVQEMAKIINAVEASAYAGPACIFTGEEKHGVKASAIAESACKLSVSTEATAIISATDTGFTARFLTHQRPGSQVILLTDKPKVYRQLSLYWGVTPLLVKRYHTIVDLLNHATDEAKKNKLIKKGDKVIVVAGNPIGQRVNMLEVRAVV
jgi:pyruvate kinase